MQQVPTGLSQPALDALETFVYYDHATKGITEDQLRNGPIPDATCPACSICHDEYEAQNILRRLPCSHVFHQACIDRWLRLQGTCASFQLFLQILGVRPKEGWLVSSGDEPTNGRRVSIICSPVPTVLPVRCVHCIVANVTP
jgi:hypothetical protein